MRSLAAALAVSALLVSVAATPDGAATAPVDRQPTAAQVNARVAPPGGMKATQTGGNTMEDDQIREARPRADGYRHVDTPAVIRQLKRLGLNTYVYLVWYSPTDWSDLVNEFAPAAERVGIRVWIYIVPASECQDNPVPHLSGRCSRPFKLDFIRWATEIAKLSVQHPNVVAWALDDFFSSLTPDQVRQMKAAQDAINPYLGFYTTAYYSDAINPAFYDRYQGVIDGIIYPYTGAHSDTRDAAHVGPNLDAILAQTEPRGLGVVLLAYTGRYLSAITPPTDRYVADVVHSTLPYMKDGRVMGITLYGLPIAATPTPTVYNRAVTGTGWLSIEQSIFGTTQPGDYAQASQRIAVNPHASSYRLTFADDDIYYDEYRNLPDYHYRQVLVDGTVAWESDDPSAGGTWTQRPGWRRHVVDLTAALRGKRSATLTIRLLDKTGLNAPTLTVLDDVRGSGFAVANGGFEHRGSWTLTTDSDVDLPAIDHDADFAPRSILAAAGAALRGSLPVPSPASGDRPYGDARSGRGRLSLSAVEGTDTPAGSCASASQVLRVDPDSPRYEVGFWQYSAHAPFPGFAGRHVVNVRLDDDVIWSSDADGIYPTWLHGGGLQGPIDVTDLVGTKSTVRLTFELCGQAHTDTRPNPPVDIGFDDVTTVGLQGHDLGFETGHGWTFSSGAGIEMASVRHGTFDPVSMTAGNAVAQAGGEAAVPVTVANSGDTPLSGQVTAVAPSGWSVEPATVPFGPVPPGGSATITLHVTAPADARPGSYWLPVTAASGSNRASGLGAIQVIGDSIEFTPGTNAEAPWLADPDGSQLDGAIFDGHGRFADATTHFTYRFDLPSSAAGARITLDIGNEFLVRVSTDNLTWHTVLQESREIHDLSNLVDRTFDATGPTIYVRVEDAKTDDGWGGWLGHLTLNMT